MYEEVTVNQFMRAWFKGERDVLSDEDYATVRQEYLDTAGLYDVDELDRVSYIHFLNNRINSVKIGIRLQREFISHFKEPFKPNFKFFQQKGHILKWENDLEKFEVLLKKIEKRELKYVAKLEGCLKDMIDKRKKKAEPEEVDLKAQRENFIRTLNSLGKVGYKIDRDETTVEDLALMIKQQTEEVEYLKTT